MPEYTQNVHTINKINLRPNYHDYDASRSKNADSEDEDLSDKFLEPGSIYAIAASEYSVDTVWILKIIEEFKSTIDVTDDYGHKYMLGHFLEIVNDSITSKR